jgi:hypothetical protein
LKSDFKEEIYTTKLDRNTKDYKQREKEAARIAQEILKASSSNVHLAEERGEIIEVDEETLYGAVIRDSDEAKAKKPKKNIIPVEKVAKDFQEFSMQEKMILNQKKQEIIQKDRESKFNELKTFSQQLNMKQDKKEKVPPSPTLEFKLNVNASSFTPNAGASAFVPSAQPYTPNPRPKYQRSSISVVDPATYFASRLEAKSVSNVSEALCEAFSKVKGEAPDKTSPLWSYGNRSYLYLFSAIANQGVEDYNNYYGGYAGYDYRYPPYQPYYQGYEQIDGEAQPYYYNQEATETTPYSPNEGKQKKRYQQRSQKHYNN